MSGKFYIETSRLEIENKSFSRLGLQLWNKIPKVYNESSKESFQKSSILRKLLFDMLEMGDDCI